MDETIDLLEGQPVGEDLWIAVEELCRISRLDLEIVVELAAVGLVSLRGGSPQEWELPAASLARLRLAGRLMRDLGVNASGAALAVELIETQRRLERRLEELERLLAAT